MNLILHVKHVKLRYIYSIGKYKSYSQNSPITMQSNTPCCSNIFFPISIYSHRLEHFYIRKNITIENNYSVPLLQCQFDP